MNNTPADHSYASALKWAQDNSGNTPSTSSIYWIIIAVLIILLLAIYVWYVFINKPKKPYGAMAELNTPDKRPNTYVDAKGHLVVE